MYATTSMMASEEILYSIVRSDEEQCATEQLIFREYTKQGYVSEGEKKRKELDISKALRSPAATTFVARWHENIVGTITVFLDSHEGLPLDKVFRSELDAFRAEGKTIAEVGQFAIDSEADFPLLACKKKPFLSWPLFNLVFRFVAYKQIDRYCIGIHPKHSPFYSTLFFKDAGDVRSYTSVNDAPVLLKTLRFDTNFYQCARFHILLSKFLGGSWSDDVFNVSKKDVCLRFDPT